MACALQALTHRQRATVWRADKRRPAGQPRRLRL